MIGSTEDQRLFERVPARFPTKFRDSSDDFGTDIVLRDLSARGIKITTKQHLFINDSVSLLVKLPDGNDPMVLNARVIWTKEKSPDVWDAGLNFHKIHLMGLHRVFKYLTEPPPD